MNELPDRIYITKAAPWHAMETPLLPDECICYVKESHLLKATALIDEWSQGPYTVRQCRGHWHICLKNGMADIINEYGDALDEKTARDGAAAMNGELNSRQEQRIEKLEQQIMELKEVLEATKWKSEEDV